jgi:plastocyanin
VLLQDQCDPVTFNAVLGTGACSGAGNVTFAAFLSKLNPEDGGHGAWRFSRETLGIKVGDVVHVANTGGELHTFTEVGAFGAGFVPPLNAALPPGTPLATPLNPRDVPDFLAVPPVLPPSALFPGQMRDLGGLSVGTHYFQCLIHPWMRLTVEVKRD